MTNNQSSSATEPFGDKRFPRDADEFVRQLRWRAEEAVAASVHHASLSQQYLALSQKFAALAEQTGTNNLSQMRTLAQLLVGEAATGYPAPPVEIPQNCRIQIDEFRPTPVDDVRPAPESSQDKHFANFAQKDAVTARQASTLPDAGSPDVRSPDAGSPDVTAPEAGLPKNDVADVKPADSNRLSKKAGSGKAPRRRMKRARELAERFRLMAPRILEQVRVRVRKSDLRPPVRTATEELKKSRRPVMASSTVCGIAILMMAWMQQEIEIEPPIPPLMAAFGEEIKPVEESLPVEPVMEEPGEQLEAETEPEEAAEPIEEEVAPPEPEMEPEMEEPPPDAPVPDVMPVVEPVPAESEVADASAMENPEQKRPEPSKAAALATVVSGRSAEGRAMMLQKYGGSAASESAVQRALDWLAMRQRQDGSWDFVDVGPCSHPGTISNPIGGTAYALLPFLAAGQTHRNRESPYRRSVEAGLSYLMNAGIATPAGLDLRGVLNKGNRDKEPNEAYYVHGAATLALCEAWAMTKDRRLLTASEGALQFLINSQDPRGGGWRYLPQQPGSTSVTAIQVMALMAAKKSGLKVPDASLQGVTFYLDSVQVDDAGRYGYEIQKKQYQASITAMALLCRIYLGWGRDDGDLRSGVMLLDKRGPYDNLYYNYFATQVMRNWGGPEWDRWNVRMRDDLIGWQEKEGDAAGSWTPRDRDDYSRAGGRLLTTCLATLTLEVYYRYQPTLPEVPSSQSAGLQPAGTEATTDADVKAPILIPPGDQAEQPAVPDGDPLNEENREGKAVVPNNSRRTNRVPKSKAAEVHSDKQ